MSQIREPRRFARRWALGVLAGGVLMVVLLLTARLAHLHLPLPDRVVTEVRMLELETLEPIDAHTHIALNGPAFSRMLRRLHMHVLDILYVDDTTSYRKSIEPQRLAAISFVEANPGQAQWCTTFDPFASGRSDFDQQAIAGLDKDFADGAVAAKIWKNVGMELKNSSGQYVMPDDPVFQPIYREIARRHKTLIAHLAEPDAAWGTGARYSDYYDLNPQWEMGHRPDAPSKARIISARDHLLAMNPDLRVVGAHLGSLEEHLEALGERLRHDPNFAVDTAARVPYLMMQPRQTVRAFLLAYQDQILYGTDLRFEPGDDDAATAATWAARYELEWRFFATGDTFQYLGHTVQGLSLPRAVLRKLYHDNALKWFEGMRVGH